ncbi:MFS transporter, partial [Actinoplanes philippinensis]|uniref:MFS transporter n=1 Tax=Actinoplanes philippinensis TaxID=35752 RepID=UPI0033EED88A
MRHLRRWLVIADIVRLPAVPRLLVLTQLAFNVGFYLVVPFLAGHLAGDLGLAAGAVGLVLGLRTFSQQGLFLLGGLLADRFGVRPVVLAGCAVRVAGFVVLAVAGSLPGVLAGAMLTGVAAALFSPAVESALAREGARLETAGRFPRTTLFAMFAVAGEVGAVTGPLVGVLLLGVGFRAASVAAAVVFVAILVMHWRWLPGGPGAHAGEPVGAGLRAVFGNRRFLVFAVANSQGPGYPPLLDQFSGPAQPL